MPHGSAVCIVTFSNYDDAAVPALSGFAEAFLDRHGIDAIHVVSRRNEWFQHADMHGAVAAIRRALAGKPAMTYGSSMGGYAAIRFAGALGATQAIAISPQYSLDPQVVPFERRWRADAGRVRFLAWPEVAAPPPVLAFYDPYDLDARHLELWARDRRVIRVRLPYAGHPASTCLAELGLLAPALLDIVAGRFDPAALMAVVHARRRECARYYSRLAAAQPPWRRNLALRLMRQAVRIAPGSTHYASQLAMALYRAGYDAEAEAAHRRSVALTDGDAVFLFRTSLFLQRIGRFADALDLAEAAAVRRPNMPGLQRHARRLHRLAGPPGPARLWLRTENACMHRLTRMAWRRGWRPVGRLARP